MEQLTKGKARKNLKKKLNKSKLHLYTKRKYIQDNNNSY